MSKIAFAENAWEEYLYWQAQDKKTLKKINSLLKTIQRDPFDGDGKPEPPFLPYTLNTFHQKLMGWE